MRASLALCLVSAFVVTSCVSNAPVTADQVSHASPSIRRALLSAEYPVDAASSGMARLRDGVDEEQVLPGSTAVTEIRLGSRQAFGDVNGYGAEDAAVTHIAGGPWRIRFFHLPWTGPE
jgi:hypothetical protein